MLESTRQTADGAFTRRPPVAHLTPEVNLPLICRVVMSAIPALQCIDIYILALQRFHFTPRMLRLKLHLGLVGVFYLMFFFHGECGHIVFAYMPVGLCIETVLRKYCFGKLSEDG